MPGGVAGAQSMMTAPYADRFQYLGHIASNLVSRECRVHPAF